ncbi:hypothetical protein [Thermosynechococcus sp.]|uniref:hypothetical protein n=1 Tax=Thermosynechococcus sp. TaxID=2814275 RepID=UPI00391B1F17
MTSDRAKGNLKKETFLLGGDRPRRCKESLKISKVNDLLQFGQLHPFEHHFLSFSLGSR